MSLKIGSNVASLGVQRHLSQSARKISKSMEALSSGSRFGAGGSDPASHAISEHLRGQIKGLSASKMNADSAIGFIQVAEGGLNEQNNILIRLRELAVQSASDTFSKTERAFLDVEYQALVEELDRIAETTQFGSTPMLKGSGGDYEFQVGPYAGAENQIHFSNTADTRSDSLGISGSSVSFASYARSALSDIDNALTNMAQTRAQFGAIQSRLRSASDNLDIQHLNISEARSLLADTDIAEASSELTRNQILQNVQLAVLSQARQQPEVALRLLV